MSNSTVSRPHSKPLKPEKPYPGFPLYSHVTGRWAKKIRGKIHYFGGTIDDPKGNKALERFNLEWPYLSEGRTPPPYREDGLKVAGLCNHYLTAKEQQLQTGELSPSTFQSYLSVCKRIVSEFGRSRLVDGLRSEDFHRLRTSFAATHGPARLKVDIIITRGVFKYAYEAELVEKSIRFGPGFVVPSQKTLRQSRIDKGKRMFETGEIRKLIDSAPQPLKTMILLGINCGYGNNDVANLSKGHIDWKNGYISFPRIKTAIERSCFLWPETIDALRAALGRRPEPQDPDLEGLIFLTPGGNQYVRYMEMGTRTDGVRDQFERLLQKLYMKRRGLGFYALRHSFQTAAEKCKDFPAIKHIMGHADSSMAGIYREEISDERLKAVTDTVREWLWGT